MTRKKIILVAGGTGGHIFPAISLAEKLQKMSHEILIITDFRGKKFEIEKDGWSVKYINIKNPNQNKLFGKIKAGLSLIRSTVASWKIISNFGADVVVGFGGYPSLPPVVVANWMRVPSILHEQNAVLGRANRWLSRRATFIAKSFKNTSGLDEERIPSRMTGNPVRNEIIASRDILAPRLIEKGKVNLLIIGGSLGANFLSNIVPAAVGLLDKQLRDRLIIKQQCRREDIKNVNAAYRKVGVEAELKTFFCHMSELLKKTHLVISRSGASTVAELAVVGRPAIFIPYPFAMDNHQQKNTTDLVEAGGAWCCEEKNITPKVLANVISKVITDPDVYNKAVMASRNCGVPDAVERLAELVLRIASESSRIRPASKIMLANVLTLFLSFEMGGG